MNKGNSIIQPATFDFLKRLTKNNNRDWFNNHKDEYLAAQENMINFADGLISRMNEHDQIQTESGKKSLYRIYNDVRFSKDKSPYNPRFAGYLKRAKPLLRGGYYFWIAPGESKIACGFGYPNTDDLKRTRMDIAINYKDWNRLLKRPSIQSTFGEMQGEKVRTSPKGFDSNHLAINLLRYKQYWFERSFSEEEVLSKDFIVTVNKSFKNIRSFFDYMSEILTTDLNGESIV
jgi:uncharacterized protein (TIGR02453 family)